MLNSDRAHNATIERFMLDNSNLINMYCGQMSVFREGFYEYINRDNPALGERIKEQVKKSLQDFINKPEAVLNIYFEKFDNTYLEDLIDEDLFKKGMKQKKIRLFKLDDRLFLKSGIAHTSITDSNIIRVERNPEMHEAICAINASKDLISPVKETFAIMESVREEVII